MQFKVKKRQQAEVTQEEILRYSDNTKKAGQLYWQNKHTNTEQTSFNNKKKEIQFHKIKIQYLHVFAFTDAFPGTTLHYLEKTRR